MKPKTTLKVLFLLFFLLIIPILFIFEFPTTGQTTYSNIPKLVIPNYSEAQQTIKTASSGEFPTQSFNDSRIFWFVQITDTHLGNSALIDPPSTWGWSYIYFEYFFHELKDINPEFVVNTGDLVDGLSLIPFYQDIRQWELYKTLLENQGMNASYYYDLVGNHDVYGDPHQTYYKTYSMQGKAHNETQFTWNVTKDYGNYTFIALDSTDPGYIWPASTFGDLDDSKLNWFEATLNNSKNSNLTFVFSHHPFYEISLDKLRKQRFLNLINEYNVSSHIFGHEHENEQYTYNDTLFLCTSALGKLSSGVFGINLPPQYRIIAVDNDGISSTIKTMGDWPIVLITSPINEDLTTRTFNLNQTTFPVRALIFNNTNINSVEFQIYNTTLEETFPKFFESWKSNWYPMYQNSSINKVWNGTYDTTGISDGFYYLRVAVDGIIKSTIKIFIGDNLKPRIVNDLPRYTTKIKNSLPWKIDLSNYEYDRYDNNSQLTWSVLGIPYPCFFYINKESDDLFLIPIEGATGLSILTLTLKNSKGESVSQTLFILITDAYSSNDIFLGLWLVTITIICVTVIIIYFRLKLLSKNKKEKLLMEKQNQSLT